MPHCQCAPPSSAVQEQTHPVLLLHLTPFIEHGVSFAFVKSSGQLEQFPSMEQPPVPGSMQMHVKLPKQIASQRACDSKLFSLPPQPLYWNARH